MLSLFDKLPKDYSKSPFPYFGRKKRALNHILALMPGNIDTLVSPFMGGGAVELAAASCGVSVKAADNYQNLVDCWKTLKSGPAIHHKDFVVVLNQFAAECAGKSNKEQRHKFLKRFVRTTYNNAKQNTVHFLLRQALSFNCQGRSLDVNSLKIFPTIAAKLAKVVKETNIPKNLQVECADFEAFMQTHNQSWSYIDPPYFNFDAIYGNMDVSCKDFPHLKLASLLKKRSNWILSYNNNFNALGYYSSFRKLETVIDYGKRKCIELLIISDDVPDELVKRWREEYKSNVKHHQVVDLAPTVDYTHDYIFAKVAKMVDNKFTKGKNMKTYKRTLKNTVYICVQNDENFIVVNASSNKMVGTFTSLSAAARGASKYTSVNGVSFWGNPV